MSTTITLYTVPTTSTVTAVRATPRTGESDLVQAAQAYVALVHARKLVHRLQRAAVLGVPDDDALDAAVLAYRQARAEAARWLTAEDGGEATQEELFATWLVEAARSTSRVA